MGLLWSLAHCCSGSERLVCKHCPASFRALVKLWKAWRKREMETVRLQSESCASALQPKYFKYSRGHNSSPFPSLASSYKVFAHKKTTGSRGNLLVTKAITFDATISPSRSQQPPETTANQSGNTRFSVATSACITSNMIDNSWATCTWCHMRNLSYPLLPNNFSVACVFNPVSEQNLKYSQKKKKSICLRLRTLNCRTYVIQTLQWRCVTLATKKTEL